MVGTEGFEPSTAWSQPLILVVILVSSTLLSGCTGDEGPISQETVDEGLGCTYSEAINYNSSSIVDDGSCEYQQLGDPILGCMYSDALNYNPLATEDNGSCMYPEAPVERENTGIMEIYYQILPCSDTMISNGTINDFDTNFREIGNIIVVEKNGTLAYEVFYTVYSGNEYIGNQTYIGYSYSSNGVDWTKHDESIINRPLEDPYVIYENGVYHLFAEDKLDLPFRNIRKYHSQDGLNWTDDGDIFDTKSGGVPNDWENEDVSSPVVWIEENGTWYMLYEGRGGVHRGNIGLAYSNDGYNWSRINENNTPTFANGSIFSWDESGVVPDDLIKIDDEYYMLYHGYSRNHGGQWKMGIAKTENFEEWERHRANPIAEINTLMFTSIEERYLFHFTGDKASTSETRNIGGICTFMIDEISF